MCKGKLDNELRFLVHWTSIKQVNNVKKKEELNSLEIEVPCGHETVFAM